LKFIRSAIAEYEKGLAMSPTNAYYQANVGRAYAFAAAIAPDQKTYYEKALQHLENAVRFAPVTMLFYENLAMAYLIQPDLNQFDSVCQRLAAFAPEQAARLFAMGGDQLYMLAERAHQGKEQKEKLLQALAFYERAAAMRLQDPRLLFNTSMVYLGLHDTTTALAKLEALTQSHPDFEPARQMLIRLRKSGPLPQAAIIPPSM
jgi:tetratricopeptide (TPR) repeat protein